MTGCWLCQDPFTSSFTKIEHLVSSGYNVTGIIHLLACSAARCGAVCVCVCFEGVEEKVCHSVVCPSPLFLLSGMESILHYSWDWNS